MATLVGHDDEEPSAGYARRFEDAAARDVSGRDQPSLPSLTPRPSSPGFLPPVPPASLSASGRDVSRGSPEQLQKEIRRLERKIRKFSETPTSVSRTNPDVKVSRPTLSYRRDYPDQSTEVSRGETADVVKNEVLSSGDDVSSGHKGKKQEVGKPAARKVPPTIKLPEFDGGTPLESHLAKLQNCSDYYEWNSKERFCHLKASLQGQAAEVLWQIGNETMESDLIALLRSRFGSDNQSERFRAELASRRRKKGESLQSVYNDIRRLLALSFPGEKGSLLEILGRDYFLAALNDPQLRVRVLDQAPVTLDQTLTICSRMEAYSQLPADDVNSDSADRRRVRTVKGDKSESDPVLDAAVDRRLRQLESDLAAQRREIRQLNADSEHWKNRALAAEQYQPSFQSYPQQPVMYPPPEMNQSTPVAPPMPPGPPGNHRAGRRWWNLTRRRSDATVDDDTCRLCHQRGHWQRQCPSRQPDAASSSNVAGVKNQSAVRSENYFKAVLLCGEKKREIEFLADSGCDKNILPKRLVKKLKLTKTDDEFVYTANGSSVAVEGCIRLHFSIDGQNLCENFLVTDGIDEPILGVEFLKKNHCQWSFDTATLVVNGKSVHLKGRDGKPNVRRIYAKESVVVPTETSVNIPVKLPLTDLYTLELEWVTEAKTLRPGVFLARTLLSDNDGLAAICTVNLSGKDQCIRKDQFLGEAEPGVCLSNPLDPGKSSEVSNTERGLFPQVSVITRSAESHDDANPAPLLYDYNEQNCSSTPGEVAAENLKPADQKNFSELSDSELYNQFEGDFKYLQPILENLPSDLEPSERRKVAELMLRNADVFSKDEYDIGLTDLLTHRINTGDHPPISETLRRHPQKHLDLIDSAVDKLLQAGVVEKSASPWSFNVVLVKKKDSEIPRVTIDFRRLNEITLRDRFPLPRVRDCLDALSGSVYYSCLDISHSFYAVSLDPVDRDKTAFVTRRGQFRYTRMPMGTSNSPSVFARLMSLVLHGLTYLCCLVFIDDTIIMGRSFEDHLKNVELVLQRFREAKLRLKPSKCRFFHRRVKFLGHIVSQDGVEVDPQKVEVILSWPFPRNVSELRGFLGLAGYYRAFCPEFSKVAEPLTQMLRKGEPVVVTEQRLKAFNDLKHFLTNPPLLALPRDQGTFVVDCDASGHSVSAVCQQWQDGALRVVEYASRTLNHTERSYCVTRKEMAALIFALKHFRAYLLGREVILRSDHKALQFLRQTKEPAGHVARYLDFISDYDFELQYRPGRQHTNSDSISRRRPCELEDGQPCKQCNRRINGNHCSSIQTRAMKRRGQVDGMQNPKNSEDEVVPPGECGRSKNSCGEKKQRQCGNNPGLVGRTAPTAAAGGALTWSPEILAKEQENDSEISVVLGWIKQGQRPNWQSVRPLNPFIRAMWRQFESLVLRGNVLCRIFHNTDGSARFYQTILPKALRQQFLELIHSDLAGHLKLSKCLQHVQQRSWWLSWKSDLKDFIQRCSKCQAYHRGQPPKQTKLNPMVLGAPMERIVIDLCGPFCPSNNFKYIFTAIDPFTKHAIAVPIRSKEAAVVARVLMDHVFLIWGLPFEVLSDLGPEFQSELSQELYKLLGIRKIRSSGYRPQTSGVIEVWHKVLNSLMAKIISESQRDWSKFVNYVTFSYNATVHSATGYSPFF